MKNKTILLAIATLVSMTVSAQRYMHPKDLEKLKSREAENGYFSTSLTMGTDAQQVFNSVGFELGLYPEKWPVMAVITCQTDFIKDEQLRKYGREKLINVNTSGYASVAFGLKGGFRLLRVKPIELHALAHIQFNGHADITTTMFGARLNYKQLAFRIGGETLYDPVWRRWAIRFVITPKFPML